MMLWCCTDVEMTFVQLFDKDNHVNKALSSYLFTTEGHVLPIDRRWRRKPWEGDGEEDGDDNVKVVSMVDVRHNSSNVSGC